VNLDRDRAQLGKVLATVMSAKEQVAAAGHDRPDLRARSAPVASVRR